MGIAFLVLVSLNINSEEERKRIMMEHVAYWTVQTQRGIAVLFGPVLEPPTPWGLAVIEVEGEDDIRPLQDNDPAVQAGILKYEVYPMKIGMIRK